MQYQPNSLGQALAARALAARTEGFEVAPYQPQTPGQGWALQLLQRLGYEDGQGEQDERFWRGQAAQRMLDEVGGQQQPQAPQQAPVSGAGAAGSMGPMPQMQPQHQRGPEGSAVWSMLFGGR
jgi:hypothetical protein